MLLDDFVQLDRVVYDEAERLYVERSAAFVGDDIPLTAHR